MSPVFLAWLVEIGIVSVRDLATARRLPYPSEFLATFVIFGGLGLVAESERARPVANVTAWGLVVATFLSSRVDFLKPIGDFLGGNTAPLSKPVAATQAPQPPPGTQEGGPAVQPSFSPYPKGAVA